MKKAHKKTLFIPLILLIFVLSIGIGFIITLTNSMKNYTIISEQAITIEDINLQKNLDVCLNFITDYQEIVETTDLDSYKQNSLSFYSMFYRFINLHQEDFKKFNHEEYNYHFEIEEDTYNIYFNSSDKISGCIYYNDVILSFVYLNDICTIVYNNIQFEFIFKDFIEIKINENNQLKYIYTITYNYGTSYCEMEILTLFNSTETVEKYILNKVDERLFSYFENQSLKYNYIISKVNNEFVFKTNLGGKYD